MHLTKNQEKSLLIIVQRQLQGIAGKPGFFGVEKIRSTGSCVGMKAAQLFMKNQKKSYLGYNMFRSQIPLQTPKIFSAAWFFLKLKKSQLEFPKALFYILLHTVSF